MWGYQETTNFFILFIPQSLTTFFLKRFFLVVKHFKNIVSKFEVDQSKIFTKLLSNNIENETKK